ncbi:hypothetical protein C3B44_04685 [Corynebacterium yudongzhengii]|uniref:Uncharacterized protein n=1 Tax=Corynebacterium yudongzhengii TaxID=2080740 RepID=A0A2U1T5A7_9CORY|nr:hypothetical protein [Corynebacterium yudongzhengii]AWB81748.1 hypothetical protein C3B44_04685 [Corynebacterium yudongzhengii]PWC01181.1 hypothetical protein DF222_08935 [Corynebacterium yudongzhengii]
MHTVVVIPASPALVEELAPRDQASRELVAAAREVLGGAPHTAGIDLVASRAERYYTAHTGSFAAWGAPGVTVGAGHYLPELIARYVLGDKLSAAILEVRSKLATPRPERLTVVVTDGSAGMTPRAPLALLDDAAAADTFCRSALTTRPERIWSVAELEAAGVPDVSLWREMAGVEKRGQLHAVDTATGVARYVASWEGEP